MNNKKDTNTIKSLAENRRAHHDYTIEDTFECGLVLVGAEVKSLRDRHLSFADSYAIIKNGEVFLLGLRIEKYPQATHEDIQVDRTRKLLLHRKEIKKIERAMQHKKMSLIPLKLYLKNGRVKLLLGLGIGKSKIDKRHTIKDREQKREVSRVMKRG